MQLTLGEVLGSISFTNYERKIVRMKTVAYMENTASHSTIVTYG